MPCTSGSVTASIVMSLPSQSTPTSPTFSACAGIERVEATRPAAKTRVGNFIDKPPGFSPSDRRSGGGCKGLTGFRQRRDVRPFGSSAQLGCSACEGSSTGAGRRGKTVGGAETVTTCRLRLIERHVGVGYDLVERSARFRNGDADA